MAQPRDPHCSDFVTPAYGAFKGLVEIDLADVVDYFEGAFGVPLVVLLQALQEGLHGPGGMAFFEETEIQPHDGGDQLRAGAEETLYQVVTLQGGTARQTDDVAGFEIAAAGFPDDAGVEAVEVDKPLGIGAVLHVHRTVFHVVQALAAMAFDNTPGDLLLALQGLLPVAPETDGQVELGLEAREVATVRRADDKVISQSCKSRRVVAQGILEQSDGVRAFCKGQLVSVDEEIPIHFAVDFPAQFQDIFGVETAADVDV